MTEQDFTEEDREQAVREMTDALKAYVTRIEGSLLTTQNHYGSYMSLFGAAQEQGVDTQRAMGEALIRVGGNEQGVKDGFKAATGEEL